jgi:hypothetical protein
MDKKCDFVQFFFSEIAALIIHIISWIFSGLTIIGDPGKIFAILGKLS